MRLLTMSLVTAATLCGTTGVASARTFYSPTCVHPVPQCVPVDEDDAPTVFVILRTVCGAPYVDCTVSVKEDFV